MNEIEKYLNELKKELRDLPEAMQADVLAEVQTHIEDGLEDETLVDKTAVQHTTLLRELGSPAELVRNLHRANWKRNGLFAALAIIPLRLLSPLTLTIHEHLGITTPSILLGFAVNFLICLVMVLLARRLQSRLLMGWWLSNTLAAAFSALFHSTSSPDRWLQGTMWQLLPLALTLLVTGFYGRFLWQNRYDGLAITLALLPFMWGTTEISVLRTMFISGFEWRHFWTATLIMNAWFLIALTAFFYPVRLQRWLITAALFIICTIGTIALWWPNPNAIFWFLMLLPLLLGLGTELAANRHYDHSRRRVFA